MTTSSSPRSVPFSPPLDPPPAESATARSSCSRSKRATAFARERREAWLSGHDLSGLSLSRERCSGSALLRSIAAFWARSQRQSLPPLPFERIELLTPLADGIDRLRHMLGFDVPVYIKEITLSQIPAADR